MFFFILVPSIEGPLATQGRGLLSEVAARDKEGSEYYENMED